MVKPLSIHDTSSYHRVLRYAMMVLLFYGMPVSQAQNKDCRLKPEMIQALIEPYNPFFTHHEWDPYQKTERARMGHCRAIMISQHGCKRHHKVYVMGFKPSCIIANDSFWLAEMRTFMYAIHHEQPDYSLWGPDFERLFAKHFAIHGVGRTFDFPLNSTSFICTVIYEPFRGANIRIEKVDYIYLEKVRVTPLTPRDRDDGWYGRDRP